MFSQLPRSIDVILEGDLSPFLPSLTFPSYLPLVPNLLSPSLTSPSKTFSQLPRSIDVILEGDLCDLAKPGDRVLCSGIHRALPSKANQSGMFKTVISLIAS